MRTELIAIPTPTAPLDGAYYEPEGGASAGAVLFFHGNTMNFYVGASRFLPPVLTRLGFACLAFNRRGHDVLSTRNSRIVEGGAFQSTREALEDNHTAAQWLAARGFPDPVVIGHSNGGMLGVQHVVDHPQTRALVLLSAGRGGERADTTRGTERLFAADRLGELKAKARELVDAGRGRELMLMPGWWYVISAESFLDRIKTVPDTIALAPKITCPVLAIRGDKEDVDRYPAEEFQRAAGGTCKVEIIPNCDHFYNGREDTVCGIVSSWLIETLRP
ncbi:MAG TPA: alpha/beta hydrolase [Burkholderiales bacterium]|nr:alpha/beta hydrolase [Burkholderiales bacterium]